jgi:GH15 family glucan-1,4-alpha-glucosidase
VLITRFPSPAGVGEMHECMPLGGRHRLIRRVLCVRGEVAFRLEYEPRFDYGREARDGGRAGRAVFRSPALSLALASPVPLEATAAGVRADARLRAGESATFVREEPADGDPPPAPDGAEAAALLDETVQFWLDWTARSSYTGRWRDMVNRSALRSSS